MDTLHKFFRFLPSLNSLHNLSIRFKVLLIVGSGVGGFAIFLLVNYLATAENSERLHQARSVYFPVLENLDTIPGRVEKLNDAIALATEARSENAVKRIYVFASVVAQSIQFVADKDTLNLQRKKNLQQAFTEFRDQAVAYGKLITSGAGDEALASARQSLDKKFERFDAVTNAYRNFAYNKFTGMIAEADHTSQEILKIGLIICGVILVVLGGTGYMVQSVITTSVVDVNRSLEEMVSGQGDLTKRLKSKGSDEIGTLVHWFNAFVTRLDSIVGNAVTASSQVDDISSQMSSFNSTLLKRAEYLKSELNDASNAVKLMLITVGKNEVDAGNTDQIAARAADSAKAGRQVMAELNKAIGEISASTERINEMISAIDGIAFQTNLLALNAAVEAARAGDHGRGFAVVAGEVRALAQRASDTAKEIKQVIKDSTDKVHTGVRLADESNMALEELYDAARKAAELNSNIARSSGEQSTDIENIAKVMSEVDRLTQESNIDIIESTQASKVLANQAERLAKLLKFFKVSDSTRAPGQTGTEIDTDRPGSGKNPSAALYQLKRKVV